MLLGDIDSTAPDDLGQVKESLNEVIPREAREENSSFSSVPKLTPEQLKQRHTSSSSELTIPRVESNSDTINQTSTLDNVVGSIGQGIEDVVEMGFAQKDYTYYISTRQGNAEHYDKTAKGELFKLINSGATQDVNSLLSSTNIMPEEMSKFIGNSNVSPEEAYMAYIRENPNSVDELNKQYPDLKLKSYASVQDETIKQFAQIQDRANKAAEKVGVVGQLTSGMLGGMFGYMQDTNNLGLNLATTAGTALLPGVAIASKLGVAMATTAAGQAIVGAVMEYINKPGELEIRRALGEDITDTDALKESAIDVLIGSVLAGGIHGLSLKLGRVAKAVDDPELKANILEAKAAVEQATELAPKAPKGMKQDTMDRAMAKAYDDYAKGEDIDVRDILGTPKTATDTPTFRPGDDIAEWNSLTNSTVIKHADGTFEAIPGIHKIPKEALTPESSTMKAEFDSLYERVSKEDIVLTSEDELGSHTYSAKATLDEIKSNEVAHREVVGCLARGDTNA